MANQKIMVVLNKAPYEKVSVVEGIRAAAGIKTMDIGSVVVFVDDGVYSLLKDQEPADAGLESVERGLRLMVMSEVPMKVVRESMKERGVKEQDLMELDRLEVVSKQDLAELMAQYSSIFVL